MIAVKIVKQNAYHKFEISGHADYAEHGHDIVCAGVSMLVFTISNQILKINQDFPLTFADNHVVLENDLQNEKINLLFETLETGFELVQDAYPDHINIKYT